MGIKQYNKKGFLLPESIKSMAAYHAKIMPDGKYMFCIHDCVTGVRLLGDLNDDADVREAVDKLNRLSLAAKDFANFIYNNYKGTEVSE
jgi:hypothetical protein